MVSERKIHIDILKGILIILVVLGHMGLEYKQVIYWFHMPAFFMVSGYLYREKPMNCDYVLGMLRRYMLPCLSYCVIGYLIYRPEGILKNVARVLYGGAMNTTTYSYPYWFVYALFVTMISYNFLELYLKKWKIVIIAFLFVAISFASGLGYRINMLPWAVAQGLLSLMYFWMGDEFKRIKVDAKVVGMASVMVSIVMVSIMLFYAFDYSLNIKKLECQNIFFDVLIPVMMTLNVYYLSLFLSRVKVLSWVMSQIGKASLTIMFTHAVFVGLTRSFESSIVTVVISLFFGVGLNFIVCSNKYLSVCLNGKYVDKLNDGVDKA